jgi:hypothetical protein
MHSKHSLPIAATSALLALTAALCACSTQATTPSHTQEQPKMTSTSTVPQELGPGIYTLAEYPQFTPQEMGQRTLALINSLKSIDDLSLEHIREATGFPLVNIPPGIDYVFGVYLPQSNWSYWFEYFENEITKEKGGTLWFRDPTDLDADTLIDMSPVCLDYDAYVSKLEQMGFKNIGPTYDELGRILDNHYVRGNVRIGTVARREADQPETKAAHACLQSLGISKVGR